REPPDPIPNSEVKTSSADGSVGPAHARVGHRQALTTNPRFRKESGVFLSRGDPSVARELQITGHRYAATVWPNANPTYRAFPVAHGEIQLLIGNVWAELERELRGRRRQAPRDGVTRTARCARPVANRRELDILTAEAPFVAASIDQHASAVRV